MATIPEITDRLEVATEKAENASQIIYDVANGDASTEVPTASGPTPTLKKWFQDLGSSLEPMLAGIPARLDRAILSYDTLTEAESAAATLPNGQDISAPAGDLTLSRFVVEDGALLDKPYRNNPFSQPGAFVKYVDPKSRTYRGLNTALFPTSDDGIWVLVWREANGHGIEVGTRIMAARTDDTGNSFLEEPYIAFTPI